MRLGLLLATAMFLPSARPFCSPAVSRTLLRPLATSVPSSPSSPTSAPDAYASLKMDEVVSLCKRRGFVFQSSEIYNGFSGFFDYGPLGAELKRNIKDRWWREFVQGRSDVVGLDASIISSPKVWEASGHVEQFTDPMVDCRETKLRFRADQLFYSPVKMEGGGDVLCHVCVQEDSEDNMAAAAKAQAKKILKKAGTPLGQNAKLDPFQFKDLTQAEEEELAVIPSPASLLPTLTAPRDFNLMFETSVGAAADASAAAYLRPETAQAIFVNFKNAQSTGRMKVPFGVAQVGKAFRNEVTPRNFIFRSREFEQVRPSEREKGASEASAKKS
jgi:glycyl-tRNA synthetase